MDVFKAGHLVLDNQLVCSFFPGENHFSPPGFPQLPTVLCKAEASAIPVQLMFVQSQSH